MLDHLHIAHRILRGLQRIDQSLAHPRYGFGIHAQAHFVVASVAASLIGMRLIAFTSGRSSVLPAMISTVGSTPSASMSAPVQLPTAAEHHRVAAVFRPRVHAFLHDHAAPRKPTPETT